MAEHREALRDGLRPADDVEDEVETVRVVRPGMRRAKVPRGLELPLVEVEPVDLGGACDPSALDDGQPNRAAADHADPCPLPHLGRLQHGADAGSDRTADQASLLCRQLDGQANERRSVQHAPRREGPRAKHSHQVAPVTRMHPPGRDRRGSTEMHGSTEAPAALAARRAPADDHSVAGCDVFDSLAHGFDDAGSLVAEQYGQRVARAGPHDVEIGVADARRLDLDPGLARPRLVEVDLLDAEPLELAQDDAAIHEESRSAARVPPIRASVKSVSAIRYRITVSTPSWPPTASP